MIHYDTIGKGQPLVLVHGFGEDYRIWDHQVQALSPFLQLIIPHLPGTGKTPAQEAPTMESMADDLYEILEKEKTGKVFLVGHSMGGYIALAFAEKYPEKLNGLGLFHSTAFPDSPEKISNRRKSIEFIQQHGSASFLASTTPNLFAAENREEMAKTIQLVASGNAYQGNGTLIAFYEAMIKRPDRTAVLKKAPWPVLFILGKGDQAVPFADTMKLVYLPDLAYIHILEASGHMGMLEAPEETSQYLKNFVQQV